MNQNLYINYSALRADLTFDTVLNYYQLDFPDGKNQVKIVCPFHEESTASCSINIEDKKFQCFGCGAKGNCLEFVVIKEGFNPEDKDGLRSGAVKAIEIAGKEVCDYRKAKSGPKGSKLPGEPHNKENRPNPSQPLAEPENGASSASEKVENPKPALKNKPLDFELKLEYEHAFLTERGITPELAEQYGIGFCKKGVMRNRIAIPIHNVEGQIVAYTGRWATDEKPENEPRYKLPKNFHKSVELYNLHRIGNSPGRHITVVEGIWSTIRLHEAGIATVGLLGTTCSDQQAELLVQAGFRYGTVILDGDEAGRKAAPELINVLSKHLYIRQIELPDGIKPDIMPEKYLDRLR